MTGQYLSLMYFNLIFVHNVPLITTLYTL